MLPLPEASSGAPVPVPVPGEESNPQPIPQAMNENDVIEIQEDLPPADIRESPPAPDPGPAKNAGPLKLAAIAGGAFLAFKLGLLDNLLMIVGLGSSPPQPPPHQQQPPAPVATTAPADARPAAKPILFSEPLSPAAEAPIVPSPHSVPPPPVAAAEWSFEGTVYDMVFVKPVKGISLLFMTQNEEETFSAKTDHKGRYKITLPARPGGFKLMADHPDYIDGYFDETDPPYKSWTMERRRQLRAAKPVHKAWQSGSALPVRRDLVLFPEITDR